MSRIKLVLAGLVTFVVLGVVGTMIVNHMRSIARNQGYQPVQPIAYSHKIHAGDNQMNCLYCHFAAERGRHAGVPPTELCMNCHSVIKADSPEIQKIYAALEKNEPIKWAKVHHLPDHAYFNHSQHVNVGKISCQECHGEVQTMDVVRQEKPLTMGWCLDCHRAKGIAQPNPKVTATGSNCSSCHF